MADTTSILSDAAELKRLCDMVLHPYRYELKEMDEILKRAQENRNDKLETADPSNRRA